MVSTFRLENPGRLLTCIILELAIAVINQVFHFFLNLPVSS